MVQIKILLFTVIAGALRFLTSLNWTRFSFFGRKIFVFISILSKLGIWPMVGLQHSGCHSRENGNPETKNRYPWIPASAGMTNPKDTNLSLRSLKMCQNFQKNSAFLPRMRLIRTAMFSFTIQRRISLWDAIIKGGSERNRAFAHREDEDCSVVPLRLKSDRG